MIAEIAFPYGVPRLFDYDASAFAGISAGMRVVVNFAGRRIMGYVAALRPLSDKRVSEMKPVLLVLDMTPSFSGSVAATPPIAIPKKKLITMRCS